MEKKNFRILIVDDDDIVRELIVSFLSREGYPVIAAKDGLEAIRLLRVEDISLVITDLKMPGAGGVDVLRNAERIKPDIAVVILTAYGTLETALEVMKEGAYDYITKPFKMQEILIVVRNAFERASLIGENRELSDYLKATYRDINTVNSIGRSNNAEIITGCIERIERLKTIHILSSMEADILKERLITGDGKTEGINI
ncbi:MAG: response regulator [Nitrospirae bacterium]|nr:response regulator [Nitrospirota bacterium]